MERFATLDFKEPVRLDAEVLEALCGELGPVSAEAIISGALEELAVRLSDLAPLYRADRLGELARIAQSLTGIASQIGLHTLARVARDVCHCAIVGDRTALAATLCRLERIGDRSLVAIWDHEDVFI